MKYLVDNMPIVLKVTKGTKILSEYRCCNSCGSWALWSKDSPKYCPNPLCGQPRLRGITRPPEDEIYNEDENDDDEEEEEDE